MSTRDRRHPRRLVSEKKNLLVTIIGTGDRLQRPLKIYRRGRKIKADTCQIAACLIQLK